MKSTICLLFGLTLAGSGLRAAPSEEVAVNTRVFNGYARVRRPDGSFQPEHYAFGEGGRWNASLADKSIDGMPFRTIAETIAGPLRAEAYLPSADPEKTDLMILVFWGTTSRAGNGSDQGNLLADVAADDSLLALNQGENRIRDQQNAANARILGYVEAYEEALELQEIGHTPTHDVVHELEDNRYFVVLKAYDFPTARREKKLKLLWEARFSISAQGSRFDQRLLGMTEAAARNFGQTTKGLLRQELPEGRVEIGTPVVLPAPGPAK